MTGRAIPPGSLLQVIRVKLHSRFYVRSLVEVFLNGPAQLSLPLYLPDDETFASFWPGDNPSLLAALQNVLRQEHSGYIYIWSREGAGRSHLLHAACAELSSAR